MPFDKLPGGGINTAPMSSIHNFVMPPRPVFPTYEVTMNALNSILPALDPVERAKRQLALASLPVQKAQLALEKQRIDAMNGIYSGTGSYPALINKMAAMGLKPDGTPMSVTERNLWQSTHHGTPEAVQSLRGSNLNALPVDPNAAPNPTNTIPVPPIPKKTDDNGETPPTTGPDISAPFDPEGIGTEVQAS